MNHAERWNTRGQEGKMYVPLHCWFLTNMVMTQGLVESIITLKKEKFPGYFSFQQVLCTNLRNPISAKVQNQSYRRRQKNPARPVAWAKGAGWAPQSQIFIYSSQKSEKQAYTRDFTGKQDPWVQLITEGYRKRARFWKTGSGRWERKKIRLQLRYLQISFK